MGARLQRLEQDNLELRRHFTSVAQENLELRQQFHALRMQFEDFKGDNKAANVTNDTNDSRAILKRLLLESVVATQSLKPKEPLGYDCVREQKEFPNLKFFTLRDWNQWKRDNPKTTRIGEEPVRGKAMSSKGINHTAPYVEHIDGTPADGDYINDARKFCRTFLNLARTARYELPRKWGDTDIWLQELFYTALRKKFPLFQLCHNNAKGSIFMYYSYYEQVTRKWDKSHTETVDLNDALHTIKSASDLEESESESVRQDNARTSKPPHSRRTSKRPSRDDDAATGPRKQARIDSDGAAQTVVDVVATPSNAFKGKQRAAPSLLAVLSTSTTALQLERRPAIIPDSSSCRLPLSDPLVAPASPSLSVPSASLPVTSSSQSIQVPHPTLSSLASLTTLTPLSMSLSHPEASSDPIQVPMGPPLDVGLPSVAPDPAPIPQPQDVAAGGSTPSEQPPAEPAKTPAPKKTRAPRKTSHWPPPGDMQGAKWIYARRWYTETDGTQDAFEAHYKSLSRAERQRLGRAS
ncbi:hypothetical protein BD309DRAFT_1023811 [Dichomitus squalens]|uniref:Uncharacterized protein n=1 Tax=Dichomitus squalens (strain LYAD-421) TaxID=732165 RepID=R7T144_DICSQ|nr:uncharacterized protein DICSQDRAFT_170075 [Dichomitus squalens LYAD-421 SS1]EJF61660.1 hypothetical protein DICSQDRAFT_170075 [Dichomitus squalens LYAD-421 SS1]TBU37138.1 hypothetical protein BD309DRAFT_1023811 [Dichomitus squalens]